MTFNVDIEATNRCNASCSFCPRDDMPHQGLMSRDTFEQALVRCIELRSRIRSLGRPADWGIGFCGLGEALVNRQTPAFVRRVREEGFTCALSSNGALLDESTSHALLDAGLQRIKINVTELDDDYEEVYKLPFARTRDNILRFKELAGDDCEVIVILVDHRDDASHLNAIRQYWYDRGVRSFNTFDLINRGGALVVDHMQFEQYEEVRQAKALLEEAGVEPICPAPFMFLFIGYDGQYYLDSSDWKKEVPLGSVFDVSFADTLLPKLARVRSREPVCKSCSLDPTNRLADVLRRQASYPQHLTREVAETITEIGNNSAFLVDHIAWLSETDVPARVQPAAHLRRIPVIAE